MALDPQDPYSSLYGAPWPPPQFGTPDYSVPVQHTIVEPQLLPTELLPPTDDKNKPAPTAAEPKKEQPKERAPAKQPTDVPFMPRTPALFPWQHIGAPGAQVADEVPTSALQAPQAPPLSPEEEAQIQIDQPPLSPAELAAGEERVPPGPPPYAAMQDAMYGPAPTTPPPTGDMQQAMYGVPSTPPTAPPMGPTTNATPENPYPTPEEQGAQYATNPERLIRDTAMAEEAKRRETVAAMLEANTARMKQAELDHKAYVAAQDRAAAERAQIETDAKQIAQYDPQHWMKSRSTGEMFLVLGSIVAGGLAQGKGGRNIGLDMLEKQIENDNQGQQFNIQTQRADLTRRSGAVNEALRSAEEKDRENAVYRNTMYEAAVNQLTTKMMDFDPQGTTARQIGGQIMQYRAAQKAANDAMQEKRAKDTESKIKLVQEQQKIDETHREHDLQYAEKMAKFGGAGAGSATNPNYTVATGFFDPFTNEPIMGKQAIGGKGKEKFEDATRAQIATYAHVQDYWDKLRTIGAKIGYHKSLGESVWSKFKDTDAAEYDAAHEALVVYLTKELGDKLTQGQLEAQSHRIPDRTNILESRDPGKQIVDAQNDADRDFTRDMNIAGINGAPIVENAKKMRRDAAVPTTADEVTNANDALAKARSPSERKDALAAVSAANERVTAEAAAKQRGAAALKEAPTLTPRFLRSVHDDMPPEVQAQITTTNDALDTYNQRLAQYHKLVTAPPPKKPDAKATKTHADAVESAAVKLIEARDAANALQKRQNDALVQSGQGQYAIDTEFH